MTTELLPCPFCGCEETIEIYPAEEGCTLRCANNDCAVQLNRQYPHLARAAWNRRASPSPAVEDNSWLWPPPNPPSGEKVRELVKEWDADRDCGVIRRIVPIGDAMATALTTLSAEIETVRAELEKFGEHRNNCARGLNGQCSCGLTAALPTEKATPNEGERT